MKTMLFVCTVCALSLLFLGSIAGFIYGEKETRKIDQAEYETNLQMTEAKGIEDCQAAVSETIQACGEACVQACSEVCPQKLSSKPSDL